MLDTLTRLYADGRLSDDGLDAAVGRGWLTQDEADQIKAA